MQVRRDTTNNWATSDPILSQGELGLDTTLNKMKIGDGVSHWSTLSFFIGDTGPQGDIGPQGMPGAAALNEVATSSFLGGVKLGEGFVTNSNSQVTTSKLYNTNATNANQHYRLELDTNGVLHLADGSIINGSTLKGIAGTGDMNFTGMTIGPDSSHSEETWMWVDSTGATIATEFSTAAHQWKFDNSGDLNLPVSGGIVFDRAHTSIRVGMGFHIASGEGISLEAIDETDPNNLITKGWYFSPSGGITFPTLSVDIHNGGVQSAQVLKFDDATKQVIITGPTPAAGNSAERIIIQGQRATGNGEGGDVYLWGGDSAINGGDIKIYAGDADSDVIGAVGGYVNIDAGNGFSSGGNLTLSAGLARDGYGGNVSITAGYAYTGTPGNIQLNTYSQADSAILAWTFTNDGKLTLPDGGVIAESGGLTGAIKLTPAGGANAYQALVIYPTAALDGDHIHLTAGGGSTELYLGNDTHYVKLVNGGDVAVRASTADLSSTAAWTFDTVGNIDAQQALGIKVPDGVPSSVTAITSTTASWELNPLSNLATTGGSGSGLTVTVTETDGYVNAIAIATAGTGYTAGDVITVTSGTSNATFTIAIAGRNTWRFGTDGRTTFPIGSVPAHSYGAVGDKEGMIVFSDNYIYYCKQDFVGNSVNVTTLASSGLYVYVSSTDYAGDLVADFTANSTGWTYAAVSIISVAVDNTFGPGYALEAATSFGAINGNDYALVSPVTPDIWKRVSWSGDTW